MDIDIVDGLDWLSRQEPTVLFALIFAGITVAILIRVNKFAKSWLERLCWIFVILSVYFLVIGFVHEQYKKHRIRVRLHHLVEPERLTLKEMIVRNRLTSSANKGSGTMYALKNDGIFYQVTGRSQYVETFNIHHWIFMYLKEHPELLKPKT